MIRVKFYENEELKITEYANVYALKKECQAILAKNGHIAKDFKVRLNHIYSMLQYIYKDIGYTYELFDIIRTK